MLASLPIETNIALLTFLSMPSLACRVPPPRDGREQGGKDPSKGNRERDRDRDPFGVFKGPGAWSWKGRKAKGT